jgi:ribose 5-phosphate isomerase B
MNKERMVIGSDHRGYALKNYLMAAIHEIQWIDIGAYDDQSSDYPIYAKKACAMIHDAELNVSRAILLCGSGIGMAIMANRCEKIYAALVWNTAVARQSREHDNTNVLVLPADYVHEKEAAQIVTVWIATPFSGKERYKKRIAEIDVLSARV